MTATQQQQQQINGNEMLEEWHFNENLFSYTGAYSLFFFAFSLTPLVQLIFAHTCTHPTIIHMSRTVRAASFLAWLLCVYGGIA